jgi:hypothetical protein
MPVPNIFGTATAAIPLSQLDQNFATAITLGNTAVYLGNTTTSLGNVTLTNVTISSGTSNIAANVSTAVGLLPESAGGTGTTTGYYGFKSRIINGGMTIDQRNAGASVAITTSDNYITDRFFSIVAANSKLTGQQNAGSVTPPAGFANYLGMTVAAAANVTVGASEVYAVGQQVEGFNMADLAWGTASASAVTLSFWVRSSVTGTFGGSLRNSAANRSYPFTYAISASNTWEQKSVTIAGDTSGTWLTTNGIGIRLLFSLGSGATVSGTAGAWAGASYTSATGAVKLIETNSATWYVTGVQLEKGSTATSFDYRPYSAELALCQRYFYKSQNTTGSNIYPIVLQAYSTTAAFGKICDLPVTMRANPTSATTATSGTFTPSTALGAAAGAFTGTNIDVPSLNNLSTQGWTGSSGLVAGNATTVGLPNNAFFSASAEL